MKRDMDLIRRIMLLIEQSDDGDLRASQIDGVASSVAAYHFRLLDEAGFLIQRREHRGDGMPPELTAVTEHNGDAWLNRMGLSWQGCEFLDKVRDEKVWKHVKGKVSALKSVSFPILAALATDYIKQQLGIMG